MVNKNLNQASYAAKECTNIISAIIKRNKQVSEKEINDLQFVLVRLLEHLVTTNSDIELKKLVQIIIAFLKIARNKKSTEEQQIEQEQINQQTRFVIYEIYKMLNPNRIAGETELQNFIDNVIVRGVEVALYYDRRNISKRFTNDELKMMAKNSKTALSRINAFGARGFGRGI